jgi:parvulin-like peptidyl-prolyl isomerase
VRPFGPIKRDDQGYQAGLRPEAVPAVFTTPAGSVAQGVVPALDGWAIVAVDQVAEPKPDPALVDKVRQALANDVKADILQQLEMALHERYTVSVDQQQLAQLMQSQTQAAQQ